MFPNFFLSRGTFLSLLRIHRASCSEYFPSALRVFCDIRKHFSEYFFSRFLPCFFSSLKRISFFCLSCFSLTMHLGSWRVNAVPVVSRTMARHCIAYAPLLHHLNAQQVVVYLCVVYDTHMLIGLRCTDDFSACGHLGSSIPHLGRKMKSQPPMNNPMAKKMELPRFGAKEPSWQPRVRATRMTVQTPWNIDWMESPISGVGQTVAARQSVWCEARSIVVIHGP